LHPSFSNPRTLQHCHFPSISTKPYDTFPPRISTTTWWQNVSKTIRVLCITRIVLKTLNPTLQLKINN
jgi:hypothetical protein